MQRRHSLNKRQTRCIFAGLNPSESMQIPIADLSASEVKKICQKLYKFARYHNLVGAFKVRTCDGADLAGRPTRFLQVIRTR